MAKSGNLLEAQEWFRRFVREHGAHGIAWVPAEAIECGPHGRAWCSECSEVERALLEIREARRGDRVAFGLTFAVGCALIAMVAAIVVFAMLFASCSGPPPHATPVALRSIVQPQPGELPATAIPGDLTVDGTCVSTTTGAPLQIVSDPDVLPRAGGGYRMAVHAYIGARNVIAVTESDDGIRWSPLRTVLAPVAGTGTAQGLETPSWSAPTLTVPVWSLLCSAYPSAPGLIAATTGRYKSLWLATATTWDGPYTLSRGPVIGPLHAWATPYVGQDGKLDGGIDEPTHVTVGPTWLALLAGTSYSAGQTPQLGLAWSIPPYSGRAWIVEPDPIATEPAPGWISQPDLVRDPRDGSYHCWCVRKRGGVEGLVHLWSADLRTWAETGMDFRLRQTAGTFYGSRCFGPTALLERDAAGVWIWRLWFSARPDSALGSQWWIGSARAAA